MSIYPLPEDMTIRLKRPVGSWRKLRNTGYWHRVARLERTDNCREPWYARLTGEVWDGGRSIPVWTI